MFDMVIKGGTIVDGSGDPAHVGDVAIRDGRIVELGRNLGDARETIDAGGLLVTPGWVDVHTHYDGQVTWDDMLEPSASNGVRPRSGRRSGRRFVVAVVSPEVDRPPEGSLVNG